MAYHVRLIMLILLSEILRSTSAGKCDRKLERTSNSPAELDGKFFITLWALNKTDIVDQYMPNTRYIVTIEGDKSNEIGPEKFTRFLLTADNKNESSTLEGTFDLVDEALTQFSDRCPNAVSESSNVPKEDVNAAWTSPPEGSGCILIRATVVETAEKWYMDEGGLVRTICQDPKAVEDDPGPVLPECCACDEAKYEVTFEGLWSRNTHPKDFPSKGWLIRFSDVIGASHTFEYRFWRYGETASEGLQQVAEFGSTRKLESELKDQSEHIRTIIKARGISHPNVTGRTFAVFRVDRRHHLMSLVSMIVPSPDWIVGVSGLELCLSNCSWIEHKELNLYPIDAGTDDGITYMSPDSPTNPPAEIRRITTSWPNDTRSPFYDPLGQDMKPMAKLHLNRQRLYEKTCDETSSPTINSGGDDNERPHKKKDKACRLTKWGNWGPCSVSCGNGVRLKQRNYKDPAAAKAHNCDEKLSDRKDCTETHPDCQERAPDEFLQKYPQCEMTEFTDWSTCTTTCGEAYKTRSRKFVHRKHRKQCTAAAVSNHVDLQQTVECQNPPCENEEEEEEEEEESEDDNQDSEDNEGNVEEEDDQDAAATVEWLQCSSSEVDFTPWSLWSPCSSTCGNGIKVRFRQRLDGGSADPIVCTQQSVNCTAIIRSCDITREDAEEICNEPPPTGDCSQPDPRYKNQRVYFDPMQKQCRYFDYTGCNSDRRNNFDTKKTCEDICIDIRATNTANSNPLEAPKKYKVSLSSVLSYHIPVQEERSGKMKRARNGDNSSDFKGIQTGSQTISTTEEYSGPTVDCEFTHWTSWTPCTSCRGYTTRTRSILVQARNGGRRCPTKLERKRKCRNVLKCSEKARSRRRRYRDHKSMWQFNEDCQLTHWSSWSPCNATCGSAMQHRTRRVKAYPYGPDGKPCTRLVEFRKCSMVPCY